jgi:hypothetical protein
MSTSGHLQERRKVRTPTPSKGLDEAAWQAWVEKGRAQGRRSSAGRLMAVKWVSLAALVVVAGLWSHLAPYDVVARFILTAGSIVMTFHAIHGERYVLGVAFAGLALLYNPVVPVFSFSGDWPRAAVFAAAIPFIASLIAPNVKRKHNA